jgi:phosphoribosyl 1,2-cyclic phosphodiesterase
MKLWVLGSGSRGNAVLLESGKARVLIDAGFPPHVLAERLNAIEVDPHAIDALLVTHEHTDHVKGARTAAERYGWTVYATAGTIISAKDLRDAAAVPFRSGDTITVNDLDLTPIAAPHDAAEPVIVVATAHTTGARAAVAYDLGCITQPIATALKDIDLLVIEANHDEAMLQRGPYPPSVRNRIAGRRGHLSNAAATQLVRSVAHKALRHVVLAHLSESCNTPALALSAVREGAARTKFVGRVTAASQDSVIGPFEPGSRRPAAVQLDLGV